jgi:hypothetical protein
MVYFANSMVMLFGNTHRSGCLLAVARRFRGIRD